MIYFQTFYANTVKESALILLQTVPKEIEVKQLKQDLVNKVWPKFTNLKCKKKSTIN